MSFSNFLILLVSCSREFSADCCCCRGLGPDGVGFRTLYSSTITLWSLRFKPCKYHVRLGD